MAIMFARNVKSTSHVEQASLLLSVIARVTRQDANLSERHAMTTQVNIHPHARERAAERGVTEAEIRQTVQVGDSFPARFGRTGFRRDFRFDATWRRRIFGTKQVEVYAVQEAGNWLVITVIARYF